MFNILNKKDKYIKYLLFIFLLTPISNIKGIESNSTSYTIIDTEFESGNQAVSTNYSLTGDVSQKSKGLFISSSLPLVPGLITSCGKITSPGTYTLSNNLTGISGTCFFIQSNNVIIDGSGYSVIAASMNNSYAVIATSSSIAGSAYGTTTLQNMIFSGFAGGVNASGNNAISGNVNGGNGGSVVISSSTIGSVLTNAGLGSGTGVSGNGANVVINNSITGNVTNTGLNGSIYINSGGNLNISNNIYTTSGTLNISYAGTLNTTNTTISSLQHFVIQGIDYGSFIGGIFPLFPGNISTCGSLYFSGVYNLTGNTTSNCNILNTGITINGGGNTITGNISANNHGATLSNINITGAVSTTGAGAGALTINNSSNLMGTITTTGAINGDGSSSLGNTTISAGGSVATSSVIFVSNVINNGIIYSGNNVLGKITNNSTINTNGTFALNASSTNGGTINGNAVFSASSTNGGTINGNATFNAFTSTGGVISFSGSSPFSGIGYVSGNVYDSTGSVIINTWIFNNTTSNTGVLKGNAVFNNSSRNTISGIVQGNATFNNSAINLGTVTGNSYSYYPVTRPLTGTTNGQVIYYGYPGLYFDDTASGHGIVGKWDDLNNWWTDISSTIHSSIIPTSGDDVIILAGNISTTTIPASVNTIIFQNSTNNGITITVNSTSTDAALFNASSTNSGTIIGNAAFAGPDTENTGTVTGFITRRYDAGTYIVLRDFTHNGAHWIVEAINGATVDLTNATYSLVINIFKALNNASFIWNSLIGSGAPSLNMSSPVSGTNIKWQPNISWGANTSCQYKIDSGDYISVNCANNGSDIPRPSAGSHTIFIRNTDSDGNVSEKSVLFTYDNTQPVSTDCSSPLDESTRPYYYLTSDVANCSITATTTLRGDDNGGGHFYTIGAISGNNNLNSITLQNITATGTISGFRDITVSSSTLSGNLNINGNFVSDNISTFINADVASNAVVNGGIFTGNMSNAGIIINSTTTPVIVLGNMINSGTINNGFILNSSSRNTGTINGTTTLNADAANQGTINGNTIYNTLTAVYGVVTIINNTNFLGTGNVIGDILDNRGEKISIWLFKDTSSNTGFIKGDAFFNGLATNIGTVSNNAYFSDLSVNIGIVQGNAYKYKSWLTSHALGGTVNGSIMYYSYPNSVSFKNISGDNDWTNISNWFSFATTTIPLGRTPVTGEDIVLFASTTLRNNITNNIYIGLSSTTLKGTGYILTGNIYGNGAYGGQHAYDFDLESITVTGTTTAIGGDGTPSVDGGDGGNINVKDSSTGVITVNGGDPLHNGGDAGTIYVLNTIAIAPNTPIMAIGGDSVGCGFGGSGGNVTLVDTSDYILIVDPGRSATTTIAQGGNCIDTPIGNPGSTGQTSVRGSYNPPNNGNVNNNSNNNVNSRSGSTFVKIKKDINNRFVPVVKFAIKLSPFTLPKIPVFGDGTKNTFSFGEGLKSFFSTKIPENIMVKYKYTPTLLSSLDLNSMNDLMLLKNKPRIIKNTKITGLFTVYSTSLTLPFKTYINFNLQKYLHQSVTIEPGKDIIITLIPSVKSSKYKAKFNNKDIDFVDNKVMITTPLKSGNYTLTTNASPISLDIRIVSDNKSDQDVVNKNDNLLIKMFKFVKNIFVK